MKYEGHTKYSKLTPEYKVFYNLFFNLSKIIEEMMETFMETVPIPLSVAFNNSNGEIEIYLDGKHEIVVLNPKIKYVTVNNINEYFVDMRIEINNRELKRHEIEMLIYPLVMDVKHAIITELYSENMTLTELEASAKNITMSLPVTDWPIIVLRKDD